jgi:hypothetical protein
MNIYKRCGHLTLNEPKFMTDVHLLHLATGTSLKSHTKTDRVLFVFYHNNHIVYIILLIANDLQNTIWIIDLEKLKEGVTGWNIFFLI